MIAPNTVIDDWESCIAEFPFLDDDDWFESIIGWVPATAKGGLGAKLKMELRQRVSVMDAQTAEVCIVLYLYVFDITNNVDNVRFDHVI